MRPTCRPCWWPKNGCTPGSPASRPLRALEPPPSPGATMPPADRHWVLMRHGESEANAGNWLAGQVDTPLTPRGRAQADAAGAALADLDIGLVVSSDLQRARDTARRAMAARAALRGEPPLPVEEHGALRERHAGEWAGRDRTELRARGELVRLTTWRQAPPGGESQAAMAARILPCMVELERRSVDGAVLVVCHGGVIRILLGLLDGRPLDDIGFFGVPNARPIHRHLSAKRFASLLDARVDDLW
ncbi:MAG: histidine phosphatase family protein [Deltaproteobacteria bacterium]|nr:MAG: histidine phosphatase family protein [Deltaproteobacteria bacterium]